MTEKPEELIQLPAAFTGFGSRADGGASLRFATQELTDVDFAQLKKIHNSFGWIVFKPNNRLTETDLPSENAASKNSDNKSPSRRLRAVLFLVWNKKPEPKDSFDQYYQKEYETLIQMYKDSLTD
jgi:hypothetical protein